MPRAYSQVVALLEEIQLARDGIQETTELLQSVSRSKAFRSDMDAQLDPESIYRWSVNKVHD